MKAKILVIDDDASLRRVLEYNLQEEGYDVQAASSGEEGLFFFGQSQPNLVITVRPEYPPHRLPAFREWV